MLAILQSALSYRKSDLIKILQANCELYSIKLETAETLAHMLTAKKESLIRTSFDLLLKQSRLKELMQRIISKINA